MEDKDHSMSNVEYPISKNIPNAETIAAIEEARSGKHAGIIDTSSMEAFIKSCEDIPD